ncbi:ATP-binding protein [Aureisphaera galaxeae]|uniref:ATP-binding protein n=1 Tax=Aureisphaera galaxeae TaxID=1538023 RepID=UPI002350FC2C|nr:ATP-binding protein [Aureisphaera galaxeae]MDC8003794.1 ATP-binding protein [Aureisphaera galaxeae]
MNTKRIVITGGPATGKTSLIDALVAMGYECYPEIIREFTAEEVENKSEEDIQSNPIVFADDSLLFNKKLLHGRQQQFEASLASNGNYIFFDRGVGDVLAYMDFFDQEYSTHFTDICKEVAYDAVFILPPWKEIFGVDEGRFEDFEEAIKLYDHLRESYSHFGHDPITVPKDTVPNRIEFILSQL